MRLYLYGIIGVFVCAIGTGCDVEPPERLIVTSDDDSTSTTGTDTETESELRDGSADEVSDASSDTDSGPEVDATSPPMECTVEFAAEGSPYVCENGEPSEVSYRSSLEMFEPSNLPAQGGEPPTADSLRGVYDAGLPDEARALKFGETVRLTEFGAGYVEPGDDVTLHIAMIHPREDYGESTIAWTALLNYKPTDGLYEHYNGERSQVLEQNRGEGTRFSVDGPIELFDITIPAEAFDGPGRYDIGFGWEFDGTIDHPSGWFNAAIFYGGCKPPDHQCAAPGENQKVNEAEETIASEFFSIGSVYPGGEHAGKGPFEVELEHGQEVTVNYSLYGFRSKEKVYALVPMLRDRPLDQLYLVKAARKTDGRTVQYRGSFQVQIPDEPGRYDVELAVWDDPFLSPDTEINADLGTIRYSAASRAGTPDLTYIVKE